MKSTSHDCVRRCDGPVRANAREELPILPSRELRIENRARPIPHLDRLNAPPGRDPKERRAFGPVLQSLIQDEIDKLGTFLPPRPVCGERTEVRGEPGWLLLSRQFASADPALQSWMQDGIDKARRSSLIQRRNLNEQNRNRTIGLSGLQKTEVAEQRNDRRVDSAVASRVHQKEIAGLGQQRFHLLR